MQGYIRKTLVLAVIGLVCWGVTPLLANQGDGDTAKHSETIAHPQAKSAKSKRGGSRWGADYFPNVTLVNQHGKSVRFYDDMVKDKVVIIYFMYTSCEDTCPLETARLVNVQRLLGDKVGKDVFMYSITVDPANDTPEVLKQYAAKFNVGPGWQFLTGNEEDIMLLRTKLGLYSEADAGNDTTDHNISLVLGNQRTGRWMKRSPFDNPYMLAAQVGSWLVNWKMPEVDNTNLYAKGPPKRSHSVGETLFRSRCISCHTFGGESQVGNNAAKGQQLTGPDLLGVTRKRDRAWLTRMIFEPDKMLAEKDPIFMQLYTRYNKISMPNFRFSRVEVDALIDYMEAETLRIENAVVIAGAGSG